MEEFLKKVDFSVAAFKTRQEEEKKEKKETSNLLEVLTKRAEEEGVGIILKSPHGERIAIYSDSVAVGDEAPTHLEDVLRSFEPGGRREKLFSILYLALKGQVEVEIEEY